MALFNKLKWIVGILMVFVLIIATNLIDRNNFVRVRDSVVSIYEDRLIAKDLIFDMLKSVQQKEVAVLLPDSAFFMNDNAKVNDHLQSLISRFEQTKLTPKEDKVFQDFKRNIRSLSDSETDFVNSGYRDNPEVINQIEKVKTGLDELSEIQMNEGSRQMSISQRALETVEFLTQMEIFILVFLAILIQIIVMYKPKERS